MVEIGDGVGGGGVGVSQSRETLTVITLQDDDRAGETMTH